ncbi:MAG TPA: ATP-binding protein [Trebonia sp.]|nr:ATP-binding protein [Trebonia sp.]
MVARLGSVLRFAGIIYIVVQVIIWHSFYTAGPWRLTAPLIAVAWAVGAVFYLRERCPPAFLACVDGAVYLGLALGAQGCVPPNVRDDAFNWLLITMSGQLVVPVWFAPDVVFVALAVASPVAYWAGAALQSVTDARTLAAAVILLLIIGLVHAYGRRELYGRAAVEDAALNQADQAASEQYAILRRATERREHERLLHDTVLNTLTALGRASDGDDPAEAVSRCQRDVALMQAALADPGDDTGPASPGLLAGLRTVAADMRARGLDVHVETGAGEVPGIPPRVALAMTNAVREALSNVAAHAGTREAWVLVSPGVTRGLEVIVRDRGIGFDLDSVDRSRLGLRRSIEERAADCGGQASIWSQPGQGTMVRLSWPAPGQPETGRSPARESLLW